MYALDNNSGVRVMPTLKSKVFNHNEPRWFTEGGNGVAPSYPGADWFNIVQAELLNVLQDGGIQPDKTQLNQITTAIRRIVANAVSGGLSGKANASHNHTMSQITDFEIKALTTEDLDTIKKTGFYKQDANREVTTARHYPENNKAGVLEVFPSTYGYMQVYRIHDNLRVYTRNMASDGTWGSWARLDGRDKANVSSPTFTGIPRTTTPTSNASDEQIANVGFVKSAIAALVGSAPATLDTLAEIAKALSNDANLKKTLLNEIGKRAPLNHNHDWRDINNKPATATRWPNATEQGFTQSIGENGWIKLPNGLILQWGSRADTGKITFPIAFNQVFSIISQKEGGGDSAVRELTKTGAMLYGSGKNCWFAIGR